MTDKLFGSWVRSRKGIIFGVCEGTARNLGLSPNTLRLIIAALALFTGIVPMLIGYVLLGLLLPVEGCTGSGYRRGSSRTRPRNEWEAKWDRYYDE